jgi:hypothetical protein
MDTNKKAICSHLACNCEIETEGEFCSADCKFAPSQTACSCAHKDCQTAVTDDLFIAPLTKESGTIAKPIM